MCGIFGYLSKDRIFMGKKTAVMKQCFVAGSLRGMDASGLLVFDSSNGNPEIYKKSVNGTDFLQLKKTQNLFEENCEVMIGHNRFSTRGGNGSKAAHPFRFGDLTVFHNGTLKNYWRFDDGRHFISDSEWLAWSFNENGIHKTLEELSGAIATVIWDNKNKKLMMIRNEERPLSFIFTKDYSTVFFASELDMLKWILNRNEIQISDSGYSLNPNYLITFDLNQKELDKYNFEKIEISKDSLFNNNKRALSVVPPYSDKYKKESMLRSSYKETLGSEVEFIFENLRYYQNKNSYVDVTGHIWLSKKNQDTQLRVNAIIYGDDLKNWEDAKEGEKFKTTVANLILDNENRYKAILSRKIIKNEN